MSQPCTPLFAALAPEEAVDSAREGLDRGWLGEFFPWYDSAQDDLRPIDVSPSWWSALADWFRSWDFDISDWFRWLDFDFRLFGYTFNLLAVLGYLVVAVLLGLLIYVLVRVFMNQVDKSERRTARSVSTHDVLDETQIEALPLPVRRHVDNLLAEAARLYQEGRYSEAIVYLFSHQLVELDRAHIIRLTRGKTNRQYLREIGPRDALRAVYAGTMNVFEDAFFGHYTIDRDRYEACWSQLDAFNRLIQPEGAV